MEFLSEYGLFLAKTATVVVAFGIITALVVAMGGRGRAGGPRGHIELTRLNDRYSDFKQAMQEGLLQGKELKKARKAEKKEKKKQQQDTDSDTADAARLRLYVLNFEGDIKASATDSLREEISAVLGVARSGDEILLRLESPGGLVHSYGLAASQLQRIRDAGIQLTVAVDKVAASGGYMMACVANRIMAAPFAVIGSIGVLMQLPNFNRLLKRANIDFEQMTAGEYKRTLTMFGENTDDDRAKVQDDLEDTHLLFKEFVAAHREQLDIDTVATGEIWYGQRAIAQGLVDELQTSDSFIQQCLAERDVFEVSYVARKNWQEKLGVAAESAIERVALKLWDSNLSRHKY
ncbi:MAG: protease SohB [Pseudomonadota bacterium]